MTEQMLDALNNTISLSNLNESVTFFLQCKQNWDNYREGKTTCNIPNVQLYNKPVSGKMSALFYKYIENNNTATGFNQEIKNLYSKMNKERREAIYQYQGLCGCDNNTQTNNYWYYQPPRYYGNR